MKKMYLIVASAILLSSTESICSKSKKSIDEFKENGGRI